MYLPPYSPDFNLIEQAFAKLKSYLTEACARSHQTLIEVTGEALSTISASDAEGFFDHCGYRRRSLPSKPWTYPSSRR